MKWVEDEMILEKNTHYTYSCHVDTDTHTAGHSASGLEMFQDCTHRQMFRVIRAKRKGEGEQ